MEFSSSQRKNKGRLIEVLEFLKGTDYWLYSKDWDNKILFLEASEEMMQPNLFKRILRSYSAQGIFDRISGLIVGRPYHNSYVDEYNNVILEVIKIRRECLG